MMDEVTVRQDAAARIFRAAAFSDLVRDGFTLFSNALCERLIGHDPVSDFIREYPHLSTDVYRLETGQPVIVDGDFTSTVIWLAVHASWTPLSFFMSHVQAMDKGRKKFWSVDTVVTRIPDYAISAKVVLPATVPCTVFLPFGHDAGVGVAVEAGTTIRPARVYRTKPTAPQQFINLTRGEVIKGAT